MREGDLHINSTEQLKQWNDNPTNEKVYVAEWFYDHMFDGLLKNDKIEEAKELHNEMVRFTEIYEEISPEESKKRMQENVIFWDKRASHYIGKEELSKIFDYDN